MTDRICLLPGCGKPVSNWRSSCCCRSHQAKWSGHIGASRRNGTEIKEWSKEDKILYHRVKALEYTKKRKQALSPWANKTKIEEFYKEAQRLTEETGIVYEVDHCIPLRHELVCGLHNEFNLRVLTFAQNRSKGNKFTIDI